MNENLSLQNFAIQLFSLLGIDFCYILYKPRDTYTYVSIYMYRKSLVLYRIIGYTRESLSFRISRQLSVSKRALDPRTHKYIHIYIYLQRIKSAYTHVRIYVFLYYKPTYRHSKCTYIF